MRNILRVATTLFVLSAAAMPAVQARELSAPFAVPVTRAGSQGLSRCTAGGNGDVLISWGDGPRAGYFMRRYDAAGQPLQSDDWYLGSKVHDTAVNRLGDFAVLAEEPDGTGQSIYVTVYKRDGTLKLPKFKVNTTPTSLMLNPVLAYGPSGRLVVVWGNVILATNAHYLYSRTFDTNASPLSAPILLANGLYPVYGYDVAMAANDNYAVVWSEGGSTADIYSKRLTVNGTPLFPAERVNAYTNSSQANGQIAMNAAGATVITWESQGQDGSGLGIYGQRYDSSGMRQGGEFRLNEVADGSQTDSHLGITAEGNFVSVWSTDYSTPGNTLQRKLFMRQFRSDGTPASPDTQIYDPQDAAVRPWFPYVAVDPAGYTTVAWRNDYNPAAPDGTEVYARRYVLDTQPNIGGLTSGVPVRGLSGAAGSVCYYRVIVPSGRTTLTIELTGSSSSTGNADILLSLGALPTSTTAEVRTVNVGNNESLVVQNVPAGAFYIGVYGTSAFSGVNVRALY